MSGTGARRNGLTRSRAILLGIGAVAVLGAGLAIGALVGGDDSQTAFGHGISTISTQPAAGKVPTLASPEKVPALTVTTTELASETESPTEPVYEEAEELPSPEPTPSPGPDVTVGPTE